ncbi:MAG: alpha/beta hydrolase [Prevotella sp.]|jgi:pimeloyl-ACP methyl ester carboxylesterase
MKHLKLITILAGVLALVACTQSGKADKGYTTQYVALGRQHAIVYQPSKPSAKQAIGIVVMHSNDNYMGFLANSELSKRGYTVIATIPSEGDIMDTKLINIKNCVEYLRKQPNIKRVLLLGHSGGATVMTAYQLIAERGTGVLKDKLFNDYTEDLSNLPKADGMLLLDANYGNSVMRLISLDPNIKGAGQGMDINEQLNLADPKVGYVEGQSSHYTAAFKKAYLQAQRQRLNSLMEYAQKRLQLVKEGKGSYAEDEPFVVAGANQIRFFNKLFPEDLSLLAHTAKAHTLLHGDGTATNEIVHSVRAPMKADAKSNTLDAAMTTTLKGFLSACAIKVTPDFNITATGFEGIDWTSNINNPIGNSEGITVPTLMVGMTGSWEYLAAELIYNHIGSKDKQIAFVEGASHMFVADPDAEKFNHKDYGDTVKALFDYVDKWLSQSGRFL